MKNSSFRRLLLPCTVALCMTASACAGDSAAGPGTVPADAGSAPLLSRIQAEVGDAACDGAQQCHTIAIGAKPCGGPDGYLAWSSKRTDATRLRALVAQHAAARKQENLGANALSTCVMETNPGATCQAAHCVTRPRGLGSVPDDDA